MEPARRARGSVKQWDDMNIQRKKIEAQMEEWARPTWRPPRKVQKSMEAPGRR